METLYERLMAEADLAAKEGRAPNFTKAEAEYNREFAREESPPGGVRKPSRRARAGTKVEPPEGHADIARAKRKQKEAERLQRELERKIREQDRLLNEHYDKWGAELLSAPQVICITNHPTIYLLIRDRVCVYVGITRQIWPRRISSHVKSAKIFDTAIGLPCPSKRLEAVETAAIKKLGPEYNCGVRQMNNVPQDEAVATIKALIEKKRI